jgi:hypothetical protein
MGKYQYSDLIKGGLLNVNSSREEACTSLNNYSMYSCPVPNYEFNPSIIFPFFRFPIFMGVSYTDVLFLSGKIRFRTIEEKPYKIG